MSKSSNPVVPAAAIRTGYRIGVPVVVNGKEILSRGEVFSFRRIGQNTVEIVLLHSKTGAFFTNVVKGNSPVELHSDALIPEPTDALSIALMAYVQEMLKGQANEFYSIMPIED